MDGPGGPLFVPPEEQKRMSLDILRNMPPAIDLSDHRTQALAEAAVEALQQLLLSQQKLMQTTGRWGQAMSSDEVLIQVHQTH
jgi:hypothetical protein